MTTANEILRRTLKIGDHKLCVFRFNNKFELLESSEVSELLGYKQHSSLRKQTLTDWQEHMAHGIDYLMVDDEELLERYEDLYLHVRGKPPVPVKPSRGRLFFTPSGIAKVLTRTLKPTTEFEAALRDRGMLPKVPNAPKTDKKPAPHQPTRSKGDRMFKYEVLQRLIAQLERLKEPPLRELAIIAAEVALGRSLPELRGLKPDFHESPTPNKPSIPDPTPAGARFIQDGYYSMTRIGEKAGGYSAKQAGQASDIVAARLGYTREQIRSEQLPFNEIVLRPDTSTGKKRPMVRFNRNFSNLVLDELRSNKSFQPSFTPGPTLPTFTGGTPYPVLSKGVFEDEDDSGLSVIPQAHRPHR